MNDSPSCLLTLGQAWELVRARIPQARLVGQADAHHLPIARVHTDTRSLAAGDLFVALAGERFDAHAFLPQARAGGAVAALAQQGLEAAGLPGIEVPDSLAGLAALATGWRAQWPWPLIAVTGSNGKTTVTQMIAAILQAWQGQAALATRGNLNNHIGVPLTLLRLRATQRVAVTELGMNHPGEIAQLAAMAQPTVALVNNAQREHLEFMHSVQAVARENASVLAALPADGVAVFPAHDPHTPLWRALAGARRCLCFAGTGDADITCQQAHWQGDAWQVRIATPQGAFDTRLHIAGRHNLVNALAASACALAAGAPLAAIAQGLAAFRPVSGRSRALALTLAGRPLTLVDDSYNANPDSVQAAIQVLAELPGPRLLVLGDMGEIGDQGAPLHAEAGAQARAAGIEHCWTLGPLSAHAAAAYGAAARHFDDQAALIAALPVLLPQLGSLLVKGSRFMRMERVVQAIETQEGAACC
ncbi:UDP-N-acetylmuramoyl-tripeptide--D-alanyl-D-alanine ligase [Melaminivora sp.]